MVVLLVDLSAVLSALMPVIVSVIVYLRLTAIAILCYQKSYQKTTEISPPEQVGYVNGTDYHCPDTADSIGDHHGFTEN